MTKQMHAVRVYEYGDSDVLTYEQIDRPEPANDEVLIRVRGAGVNPIDWMIREGFTDEALDPDLPWIPGWDLSGTIESVGPNVTEFELDQDVFGMARMPEPGNAYAEYAAVPVTDVAEKPASLSHTEAASLPMVSLTARHALLEEGGISEGDRVLIQAAAGGVGHIGVQIASNVGAHVIGTASARNKMFLRELGVDEFVDYRNQRFEDVLEPVDVVLDTVGDETLERSIDVLKDGGSIVTLPVPPSGDLVDRAETEKNADIHWFSVEPDRTALDSIADQIDAGNLRPTVSDVYPFSEAKRAHEESESGHVRGKLVLRPETETPAQ